MEDLVILDVNGFLSKINLDVGKLKEYEEKKRDLVGIDFLSGPLLMRDFMYAYEESSKLATRARKQLELATDHMKHEEAKAILERAPVYFEQNDTLGGSIKDSNKLRETYLHMDREYLTAKEVVAAYKAIVRWLDNKTESFKMAHDDAKKIYAQLASGPSTTFEGFRKGEGIGITDDVLFGEGEDV